MRSSQNPSPKPSREKLKPKLFSVMKDYSAAIDATAMQSLESLVDRCAKQNVTVVFSHVNDQPRSVMEKDGLVQKVGAENFCPHIDAALERAQKILDRS